MKRTTAGKLRQTGRSFMVLTSSINRKVDRPERHQSHPSISKNIPTNWGDLLTGFVPLAAQTIDCGFRY
jgi:hypothetical protein